MDRTHLKQDIFEKEPSEQWQRTHLEHDSSDREKLNKGTSGRKKKRGELNEKKSENMKTEKGQI